MDNEFWERNLAWFIYRAAFAGLSMREYEKHRDVIIALAHYGNGTALSRDYRAIRGE
jgi:hypothetical protein